VRLAAFGGLVGLAFVAALAVILATGGPGLAGSSGVRPDAFVVTLPPGQSACQAGQSLPPGASSAQLVVGTWARPTGTIALRATKDREVVARGSITAPSGIVNVPIKPVSRGTEGVVLCLRNVGPGPIALAGRPDIGAISVTGRKATIAAALSVLYPSSGDLSWTDQAGSIAERFSRVRWAPFGSATLWATLLVALMAGAGGIVATVLANDD